MVWLFGGGWLSGNGNSDLYGPQLLLDHNVILVSGNYRLGVLGFLSTGTRDCPGNNGLKDQLMMLKWVKENIAVFGGDPNDVTIFGQSAGGGSVGLQMYSYLSKGELTLWMLYGLHVKDIKLCFSTSSLQVTSTKLYCNLGQILIYGQLEKNPLYLDAPKR